MTEEHTEEYEPIDEEVLSNFKELFEDVDGLRAKYTKLSKKGGEVAGVYRDIAGDILSLIQDVVRCTGSGFQGTFELLAEEQEGEVAFPEEAALEIGACLLNNMGAFRQLSEAPGIPDQAKEQMTQLHDMNKASLDRLVEATGNENLVEEVQAQIQHLQQVAQQEAESEK